MTTQLFQLAFYDHTGDLQTVVEVGRMIQLRYSDELNGFGALQFTIPHRLAHPCMAVVDTVCVPMFSVGSGSLIEDGAYFLRFQEPLGEGDQDLLVVAGYSVEWHLWRNIFIAEDDPLEANGFSTKSGSAAPLMREIVYEQCISPAVNTYRAIPNMVAPNTSGGGFVAFREEDSETKIIEFLKNLGRAGNVDFWVEYDPSGPTYTVQFGTRGTDKRKSTNYPTDPFLYFAPNVGNIDQPDLTIDRRKEQNFVYVFGQGPAGTRLRYGKAGQGTTDSPWNRLEFGVQARNTRTVDDWITEADNALAEKHAQLTAFTFLPKYGSYGASYHTDWVVGDLVTAAYQNQEFELRIVRKETNVSETEVTTEPEMELL